MSSVGLWSKTHTAHTHTKAENIHSFQNAIG